MKQINLQSTIQVYENLQELPEAVQELMQAACTVRDHAYAPYSDFQVGAAIRMENDEIISGSNQENAAYPSGLCAERTAIFYAGAKYPKMLMKTMAISVKAATKVITKPTPPCGACRQSIAEYEYKQGAPIAIYFMGESGEVYKTDSLVNILPLAFDSSFM